MAVKPRTTDTKKKEDNERIIINPFDKALAEGVEAQLNADSDAWAAIAPPTGGNIIYRVKLFVPQNSGYEMRYRDRENEKDPYYQANIEARIMDGEFKDQGVYADASTRVARGREISTAMALMRLAGKKVPSTANDAQQIRLFAEFIKTEPVLFLKGDWSAWSKSLNRNVYTKMIDFPEEDGVYQHIVQISLGDGTKEEIVGRFKVKKWFSLAEAKEAGWTEGGMAGAGKGTGKKSNKVAVEDEDEDEDEAPKPVKKTKKPVDDEEDEDEAPAPVKKKKPAPVEEDEDEEEEEVKPVKKSKKPAEDEDEDVEPVKKKKKAAPVPVDDDDDDLGDVTEDEDDE